MKATHYGTCQFCGSLQKTDAHTNRLADHGYTIERGWQQGTCKGSGQLPFEVSKDYVVAVLERFKEEVASFVPRPCPQSTGTSRWDSGPAIAEWKAEQFAHSACKQFIAWAEPRVAAWAPTKQRTVKQVESEEACHKTARSNTRALSSALKKAKHKLTEFGEEFERAIDLTINAEAYASRRAFYESCAAAGDTQSCWDGYSTIIKVPAFACNRVAKLIKITKDSNNADLIAGAEKLEQLSVAYESAKTAYEAAK